MSAGDETTSDNRGLTGPPEGALDSAAPVKPGTPVWVYDRSAVSRPALIASRLDRLAAAVAASGMVVGGRSSDTGSGFAPDGAWAGWETTIAAVASGQAAGIALAVVDRLGRDPVRRCGEPSPSPRPAGTCGPWTRAAWSRCLPLPRSRTSGWL
jgi:hypothetical protein